MTDRRSTQRSPVERPPERLTAGHWGISEVMENGGRFSLRNWSKDPNPTQIGLDQMSEATEAMRVRRPSFRKGWLNRGAGNSGDQRGSEPFVEVPWDEANEIIAIELSRVIETHGNDAVYGGSYGWGSAGRFHHAQSQIHRFLSSIGGYVRSKDSYSYGAGSVILPHIVAPMDTLLDQHSDWSVLAENTDLFVAFGGLQIKNTQMTAGGVSRHNVLDAFKRMQSRGTRFINISPLRSGNGVEMEWLPIRPNTDVAMILALCYVILQTEAHDQDFLNTHCVGFESVREYLLGIFDGQPKDPAWACRITGVAAEYIDVLARELSTKRTMVNASWSLQRQRHGEQTYWAIVTLAAMLGQIGLPGGGFGVGYGTMNSVGSTNRRISGPRLPQGRNAVSAYIPVARIADMLLNPTKSFTYDGKVGTYPDIRLIYWAGGNPFHHHQDLNRFLKAWKLPETIIVHEQYWTATAKASDIVLPACIAAERDDLGFASREGYVMAMHRFKEPLADAKSDYDIFLGIAEKMGFGNAFGEGLDERGWLIRMYEDFRARVPSDVSLPPFDEFWRTGWIDLGRSPEPQVLLSNFRSDPASFPLPTPSGKVELSSDVVSNFNYADCPGRATWLEPEEWLGSTSTRLHPIHLVTHQPKRRLHSQLDHSCHSKEGKVAGREPILLNDHDAQQRNLRTGDLVRVYNARGECLAGVQVTEDVMPGVAIMATGAWFDPTDWTRPSLESHGNPNVLTMDQGTSALSQGCSALSCLVQVERYLDEVPPVRAFELPMIDSGD
ncbi:MULTISPECIES: molybdopterin-dependent oxidoreductase [unclassified Rhizobium]|uniref:molybdopterin-dependent oxidoreductase n=1 Tax=unclassified Rhizobium TaxID=2613769 RepID=UPI0006F30E35|nr:MULTISPECIES: molybdopterin-dependent oxidoreductase [unclassified Rhizobium]KQV39360.1 biotin transporter BioY [Rhizobium sp. Root1212]KRD35365.1 biotin transporter BioY [Rhizobium sp. Root268]